MRSRIKIVCVLSSILFLFLQLNVLFADIEQAEYKALSIANQRWGDEVKIFGSTTFYNLDNLPVVYMFAVYKNISDLPTENDILLQVTQARNERIRAEIMLQNAFEIADYHAMQQAHVLIAEGWRKMLNEEHFGTVVIDAEKSQQPVEAYSGLPLQYVAQFDARKIAADQIGRHNLQFVRFIFQGVFDYLAEYENYETKIWINLKTFDFFDDIKSFNTLNTLSEPNSTCDRSNYMKNFCTAPMAETPPFEYKIIGVPDYPNFYRMCAEHAAGNVLGYWDDRGYPLLIEGGGSNTAGHRDPDGYGWKHLCRDDLAKTMEWIPGVGTIVSNIDKGIEEYCNDSCDYSFQSVDRGWKTPASEYTFVRNEIRHAGRPFVYTLQCQGWSGLHSVTVIGYGADLIDSYRATNDPSPEIYTSPQVCYFYICHDVNSDTGTDIYLYWTSYTEACIHTVVPGSQVQLSTNNRPEFQIKDLIVSPNPFNPETQINFKLTESGDAQIWIINLLGQRIKELMSDRLLSGTHSIRWNGLDDSGQPVSSGIYFCSIRVKDYKKVVKLNLVR